MKRAIIILLTLCGWWCGECLAQTAPLSGEEPTTHGYKNPVLPGFYPDPSVCRVDDTYYLVNSSFQFFPGVPLHRSHDLIHWEAMGHVLTRPSQLNLEGANYWTGIYAPTIRHHEGRFYMVTTNVAHGGNFYVWTDDIEGEWSEPIFVEREGIDPDLFFDEDGRLYYTSTIDAVIRTCEIDPATGEKRTELRPIWEGTGGRHPEAPHLYKKDGWYYLLIAEGGTEYGHQVTIARSRSIWGPYRSNPANPILTHRDKSGQDNPIQGVGHADLIEAHDGSWWLVALGFRPFDFHHVLGRETLLAPVRWDKDAWPVVNGNGTLSVEMDVETLPQRPVAERPAREEFEAEHLGPEWHYLLNPAMENYSLTARKGWMRLQGDEERIEQYGVSPTALLRRLRHHHCTMTTRLDFGALKAGDEAGMSLYLAPNYQLQLAVEGGKLRLRYRLGSLLHEEAVRPLKGRQVELRIQSSPSHFSLLYSTDGAKWQELGRIEARVLSKESAGGFTGLCVGLYAQGRGYADFDYFDYRSTEEGQKQ